MLTRKDCERLLPAYPPLTGTRALYDCNACGHRFSLDSRLDDAWLPRLLRRLAPNRCPRCGAANVRDSGRCLRG
ncbi:MAG: hypothetical protein P8011_15890 [Acidihalobacter sp.]|uniref:hypothetical protein n=1 Tax=Acidihalobacter sp. TaxID=1872108 RepID=UPI00307F5436